MSAEVKNAPAWQKAGLVGGFVAALLAFIWLMQRQGAWFYVGAAGATGVTFGYVYAAMKLFARETVRPAMRRYTLRFGGSMSAYVLLLLIGVTLHNQGLTEGPLGYVIALAPAVAVLCAIASLGFYVAEETDEFIRANLIQSLLWGTGATLGIATVWGFLETFGKAPHVPGWATVPVFATAMGLAQALISRRYR
ncbi:hypothetical protein [Caulobacter soli]|uniref:hypothetical protein n=1 Tax=Caulobacter soli TaxID=2708539 RepID=UPI0013ECC67D|nr:hypothetical protein [Caulobacter soli]